jgi:PUB domain/VHL beta domain
MSFFSLSSLGITAVPRWMEECIFRLIFTVVLMVAWQWYLSTDTTSTVQTRTAATPKQASLPKTSRLLAPLQEEEDHSLSLTKLPDVKQPTSSSSTPLEKEAEEKVSQKTSTTSTNGRNQTKNTSKNSSRNNSNKIATTTASTSSATTAITTEAMKWTGSDEHPGLEGFWYWADIEMSLFRIYNVGRNDGVDVIPPYVPKSRAGQVAVSLRVENATRHRTIAVYWTNYKGREERKTPSNTFGPGATWTQTTWLEHPWVFRDAHTDEVLLHYIPERIIPTCVMDPTVDAENPDVGLQRFIIKDVEMEPDRTTMTMITNATPFVVTVHDPVLPFPARQFLKTQKECIAWMLLHLHRMQYSNENWNLLTRYLTNIVQHPSNVSYRQIRISNGMFFNNIWNTPARGLLLALGFVERFAYAELGRVPYVPLADAKKKKSEDTADETSAAIVTSTMPRDRVQDVAQLLFHMEWWRNKTNEINGSAATAQPAGADGSGRAGFGIAGATKDFER